MMVVGREKPGLARRLARLGFAAAFWIAGALTSAHAAPMFDIGSYSYYTSSYIADIEKLSKGQKKTQAQLQKELSAAISAGNPRNTAVVLEQIVALSPNNRDTWNTLAEQLLVSEPFNSQDVYELKYKALGAAIRAYELSKTPVEKAAALNNIARALVQREEWRPALNAYRESLALVDDSAVREAYEAVRKDHGFRVVDYTVENDAAQPSVCVRFSDPVSNSVSDFSPYFTLEPGPVSAVSMDGTKLCVEGLKHGGRYKVGIRKGLPSSVDEVLQNDIHYDIYVRDRAPSIRFAGKSYVLPRTGQNGIPLVSVNAANAKLKLYRVSDRSIVSAVFDSGFMTQISSYELRTVTEKLGRVVWQGSMALKTPPNQDVTTAFPVDEALGKIEPGLYMMTAAVTEIEDEDTDVLASQWFVVSDLGMSTVSGKDGLHVSMRSIETAEPLANVEVRLLARNNEVLGTVKTDNQGEAVFEPGLTKGEDGLKPALVIASDDKNDYAFMDLSQSAFDFSDRGDSGREISGAADAFVYVERGIYRRGETVRVGALLRDGKANSMNDVPLTLVVKRPDGVEHSRMMLKDQGAGGRVAEIPITSFAAGGTWRVIAYTDPKSSPVGETSFLVEDYVPNRIEFDLASQSKKLIRKEPAKLKVDGRYLFGAPAAKLDIEGSIVVFTDPKPFPQWKDYVFGLSDEIIAPVQNSIENLAQTDEKGHADLVVPLPDLPTTLRPLQAQFRIGMRESGGRAVSREVVLPVVSSAPMLGLRAGFSGDTVGDGQTANFTAIAVDPNGDRVAAKGVTWTLKRVTTTYQWYRNGGSWNYEPVTTTRKVAGGTLDITADRPADISVPVDWGKYWLEIAVDGMASSSSGFYAGYYTAARADTPDTLPVALDRTSVKSGETIEVKIDSRFAGKASVQVVGDGILASKVVDVPEKGTTVPIKVGDNWGTGAYVVVTHFRPMDVAARRMPTRSVGLAWFGIDRAERTLKVELTAPAVMKPRQKLKVPVKVEGVAGQKAYFTLAAVDVGILNLTGYTPPNPEEYYFNQKRLSGQFHDLYGQLINGMDGARGKIRSGGDGGGNYPTPPPTQPPLALFSGVVEVGADGTAQVEFDLPAFNGTVRLMAVAWTTDKVGHASSDVVVRDPVVLTGTLPRFLAAGDESRFRLDITNVEAVQGDYTLAVTVEGPVSATSSSLYQSIKIGGAGSRSPVVIPIKALGVGTARIVATLAGPGGVSVDQTYALGVIPANPYVTRRKAQTLEANGAVTLSPALLEQMVPGTGSVSLSVGPQASLDVAALLRDLDRYPYGCSEQLVSRALPLLYLTELGGNDLDIDGAVKERLSDTVQRLLMRQDSSGAFGLWSADSGELWLSAYVTDFLLRAREKGYAVPEGALTQAVDYLRNRVGNSPDVEEGRGEDVAYALYTLARAGRAPVGDLKYFADTKIALFGTPMARAQIGAALAMLGDKNRANAAFVAAAEALQTGYADKEAAYRNYGSPLRDAAAMIALAEDNAAHAPVIKAAMQVVNDERSRSRYASTQEMTWMILAARTIAGQAANLRLDVDGEEKKGAFYKVYRAASFDKSHKIGNLGQAPVQAVVAVSGSPVSAEPEAKNGMSVSRNYYNTAGEPVDPSNVKQNMRLVVVLSAEIEGEQKAGNFLLVDRLPAGFEIENPRLVATEQTGSMSWLTDLTDVTHTEFRDDRFVAAFADKDIKVAYIVRAVTPGRYVHPGTTVEDMYQPVRKANLASSVVVVEEK